MLIFSLISILFSSQAFTKWDLNDVSYLYPLKKNERGLLLKPSSSGRKGKLLENISALDPLRLLNLYQTGIKDKYQALSVVGLRLDPCFRYSVGASCSAQLRLIWQPVYKNAQQQITTMDAALHSFYDLSGRDFKSFLQELKKIASRSSVQTSGLPLQVHPKMQGVRGDKFTRSLNELVLKYAGNSNLKRITFMDLLTEKFWWQFGGFDRVGQSWRSFQIPRLEQNFQDFFNEEAHQENGMKGVFLPTPQGEHDRIDHFLLNINTSKRNHALRERVKSTQTVLGRIDNPEIHSANTLDCVTCHMSEASSVWLENEFKELMAPKGVIRTIREFLAPMALTNPTRNHKTTKSLRMFGYFGSQPFISQRTINESVKVVNELNSK